MTEIAHPRECRAKEGQTKIGSVLIWLTLVSVCLLILPRPAQAVPAFSRKYNLPCERCHSMIPRLNTYGYAFYRAGFRLAGPNKPLTLSNSTDLLSDVTVGHVNPGHSDTITDDNIRAKFIGTLSPSVTLHIGYNFGLRSGVSSGFDELWVQYNSAPKGTMWSVRIGQIPVLDGYNLLGNRNISLTDPQLLGPFGALSGDFGNLSLSDVERGLQAGYTSGRFSTRFSLLYGVKASGDLNNEPDIHNYLLQTEYFLDKDGSAIQAFYAIGKTSLADAGFTNNLQRAGIFGTWGHTLKAGKGGVPALRFELNGGATWGEDQTAAAGTRQNSVGTVLEADLYLHNRTAFFARYDGVRLGNAAGIPTSDAVTAGITHRFTRFLKAELEFREQRGPYNASILGGLGFSF